MIDWKSFELVFEAGEFHEALAIVVSGVDGDVVDGDVHVIRCKACDENVEDAEAVPGSSCPHCAAEKSLRMFCRNHPGFFDEEGCLCCKRGLPTINHAPEWVPKVVVTCYEVGMLETKGTLLKELKAAIRTGDEARAAEIFESKSLVGWKGAEQMVDLAKQSRQVVELLGILEAAEQDKDYCTLVETWDRHRAMLVVRTSAAGFRDLVEEWRPRNKGLGEVLAAWQTRPLDDQLLVTLWGTWREQVWDHPGMASARRDIQRRVDQQVHWTRFTGIDEPPGQRVDELRTACWRDDLFQDWGPAAAAVEDLKAARSRLETVAAIRKELEGDSRQPHSDRGSRQRLVQLGKELSPGYDYDDGERVELADRQLAALSKLESLVRQGESDLAVIAAWKALGELHGEALLDDTTDGQVVQRALQREDGIHQVQSIAGSELDDQEMDRQLLEAWAPLLDDCPDVQLIRDRYSQAEARRQLLVSLDTGIRETDVPAIAVVAVDPLLENWPFSESQRLAIDDATRELDYLESIEAAVDDGDVDRFAELFDAKLLKRHENRVSFVDRRDRIVELATSAVIPNARNGMKQAFVGGSKLDEMGTVRVRWTWPDPRISSRCRLRICREPVGQSDECSPADVVFEQFVPRSTTEIGDGFQPLYCDIDWSGCRVIVQCMIDIGFATLEGEPLVLGVLDEDSGRLEQWHGPS